jgi:hypothetical protein
MEDQIGGIDILVDDAIAVEGCHGLGETQS